MGDPQVNKKKEEKRMKSASSLPIELAIESTIQVKMFAEHCVAMVIIGIGNVKRWLVYNVPKILDHLNR